MKSLTESILASNNASRYQQAILDYLNSRFCPFDNSHSFYKYTVGKDSRGWFVDVDDNRKGKYVYYKPLSDRDDRSLFDGWYDFNKYVRQFGKNDNPEGWIVCPEFRYRNINMDLLIVEWRNLEFLHDIDHIKGGLVLNNCITHKDQRIYVNNLQVDKDVSLIVNDRIRGYKPESFFKGNIKAKSFILI